MCAMTHFYVCHDKFVCVPWLISMCAMTNLYVCQNSFVCVLWLICMCAMTHLYVCHDSFVSVPWLICMGAMTHLYMWHDHPNGDPPRSKFPVQSHHGPHVNESWPTCEWCLHSHSPWPEHPAHDSLICLTWLIYKWHHSCIHEITRIYSYVSCLTSQHAIHTLQRALHRLQRVRHILQRGWCTLVYIHMYHASLHDTPYTHSKEPYTLVYIHMYHASFICNMTHSFVSWLIHKWHLSCIHAIYMQSLECIHMYHVSLHDTPYAHSKEPYTLVHIHMYHNSLICVMTHS